MWREVGKFRVSGKQVRLEVLTGDVLETSQRSDTYVSGSGRVGTTVPGYVEGSSSVSSQVVVTRDVFLRDEEGKEHSVRFNVDTPLRTGHKLSVFKVNGKHYRVYNHSTRTGQDTYLGGLLGGTWTGLFWGLAASTVVFLYLSAGSTANSLEPTAYRYVGAALSAYVFPGMLLWLVGAVLGAYVIAGIRMKSLKAKYLELTRDIREG